MPATSQTRPASERQLHFLRSLVAERTAETLGDRLAAEVEAVLRGGPIARDLIDRVMAVPRQTPERTRPAASDAEQVPTPSSSTRAGRMLLAGGIEATATLTDGRHVTVIVRTRKRSGRGWANGAPGEDGARTSVSILGQKVGWISVAGGLWHLTLRTRRPEYVAAIRAIFIYANGGLRPGDLRVQEASRCGRCFRTLTDPVSIDRGIGPECFGRDTGSQHVARERAGLGVSPVRNPPVAAEEEATREQEIEAHDTAAFLSDPDYQAGTLPRPGSQGFAENAERGGQVLANADHQRARDLIAEALDAYFDAPDARFALGIFDQLAAR